MQIHIVKKGDTLWKISREYGVSFDDLKKINAHLANPEYIVPGMKIFIPETKKAETMQHPYGDNRPNKKGMMGDGTAQPYDGNLKNIQKSQPAQVAPAPKAQQVPQVPPIQKAEPIQTMPTMPPIQPKPETKAIPIPIPIPIPVTESKPAPAPKPVPKPVPKSTPKPVPAPAPKPIAQPAPAPKPVQPIQPKPVQPIQVQPMPVPMPMPIPIPCPPMHQPVYTMPCPPMPCPPMPCMPDQPVHYLPYVQPMAVQPAATAPMHMTAKPEFEMPSPNSWMLIESTSMTAEGQVEFSAAPSHPRMHVEEKVHEQVMQMFVEDPSSAMEMAYDYMHHAQQPQVHDTYVQPQYQQYPAYDRVQCSSCGGSNHAQPEMYAHNPYLGGYPCPPQHFYQPNFHCPPYPHRHF